MNFGFLEFNLLQKSELNLLQKNEIPDYDAL